MTHNMGNTERMIRIGTGILAGIAVFRFAKSKVARALLGSLSAAGLQSGLTGYCALKQRLGLGTEPGFETKSVEYSPSAYDPTQSSTQSQAI